MENLQRIIVKSLRKGLLDVMEGTVKAIRKRKLSKGAKDAVVFNTRGAKQRKTSLDKNEDKKTRKKEEGENNALDERR